MKEREIKNFFGGYGRIGRIWVEEEECEICGEERICIASDGSEGEYGHAYICSECVEEECNRGL